MSFTAAFNQFNVTLLNKNSIHYEGFLIFIRYELLRQYPKINIKNKSNFFCLKMQHSWQTRHVLPSSSFEIFQNQKCGSCVFNLKKGWGLQFHSYHTSQVTSNHLSALNCDHFAISLLWLSYLIVGIFLLDRCSTLDDGHNKQQNPILPLFVHMTTRRHAGKKPLWAF